MKFSLIEFLDERSKQVRYFIVNGKIYVVKKYASETGLIKWFLITTSNLAIGKYPFEQDPSERLEREVNFMKHPESCFDKPQILLVDYSSNTLIRGFIGGDVYSYSAPNTIHYKVARELGKCHERGWALGDAKISNFVYTSDEHVYIVDAEQATREHSIEHAAWDLLVYVSTLTIDGYWRALYNRDVYERVLDSVLGGYLAGNSNGKKVLKKLLGFDFKTLTYMFVPFPFNYLFTKKVEKYVERAVFISSD